jgi:hypothetical protein
MNRAVRLIVLCAIACQAAFAAAQTPPPASTVGFAQNRREPDLRSDSPLGSFTLDEPLPEPDLAPRPIDSYLNAAPPADPPPPQWGSLVQPLRQPLQMPVYNYVQVGPPRLVVQREWLQPYTRPVPDPDQLLVDDARLNMPIDLYRPDGLAPPGVVGDHTLKQSHALFSYRYSVVGFDGSQTGIHPASTGQVLRQFPFAPTREYRQRHLLLLEYATTDDFTWIARLPIYQNSIDYAQSSGGAYHSAYTQVGDVQFSALYVLKRWRNQQLHLNLSVSIPTNIFGGSLNTFPVASLPNLSYPLRSGTGSYDLLPGFTYRGQTERWTWGFQTIVDIPTGHNRYGYEVGNSIDLNAWLWRRWSQRLATSFRLEGQGWGNIRGFDRRLVSSLAETNMPSLQGGTRLDVLFGLNYYVPWVRVPGNWFSIESGFPAYQNLHGPQPRATWLLNGGWNMMW